MGRAFGAFLGRSGHALLVSSLPVLIELLVLVELREEGVKVFALETQRAKTRRASS